MKIRILGLFILALHQGIAATAATESVVSGRAISNTHMSYVKFDCPKGYICLDGWFRWVIDVKETLRGPPVTGRVVAARMQHATAIPSYERRLRTFVLSPIEDPRRRAYLRSDYYLISTSLPERITEVHLTILSSGICSVDGHRMDCSDISRYLHSRNIKQRCHILTSPDSRASDADVAAALKSLQGAGGICKIGYVTVKQRQ